MKKHSKAKLSDSFLRGYARALSVYANNTYPDLKDDRYKDYLALRGDWLIVGKAIQTETG